MLALHLGDEFEIHYHNAWNYPKYAVSYTVFSVEIKGDTKWLTGVYSEFLK